MTNRDDVNTDKCPDTPAQTLDHIHHIAIVVRDIKQGVAWYTDNFNCTIDYVDDSWALLNFANTQLALVLPHQHPGHFAVSRSDAGQFGNLVTHRDGLQSTYIKDVAGNHLEILKPRSIETPQK